MFTGKKYKFTKKITPKKSIMSVILGLIACVSEFLIIYLSYTLRGAVPSQYGVTLLLAAVFALVGMVLAVISLTYKEIYRLCPILGVILNGIAAAVIIFIVYIGH